VPGAESELATEHLERLAIVRHGQSGHNGRHTIWHGI
jgi:hypothetical protein